MSTTNTLEVLHEFHVPSGTRITRLIDTKTGSVVASRYECAFTINYALRTTAEQEQMADNLRIACDGGDDV